MLTVAEAAVRLGRSPETVRRWIGTGRLPATTDADGRLEVTTSDVDALRENGTPVLNWVAAVALTRRAREARGTEWRARRADTLRARRTGRPSASDADVALVPSVLDRRRIAVPCEATTHAPAPRDPRGICGSGHRPTGSTRDASRRRTQKVRSSRLPRSTREEPSLIGGVLVVPGACRSARRSPTIGRTGTPDAGAGNRAGRRPHGRCARA